MTANNKQTSKKPSIVKHEFTVWSYIKYRFELQGLTFGIIARKLKVNKKNITRVKHEPCPKYERIIADYLGMQPQDLWPHRYTADHQPNRISLKYHKEEFIANRKKKRKTNENNKAKLT